MVWKYLNLLSALLEPDERESTLGDISERGADTRALLSLLGLVLLRQLQAWKSWRPWLLTLSLLPPVFVVIFPPFSIATVGIRYSISPSYVLWIALAAAILTALLTWSIGVTLASLGKRSTLSILPILITFALWIMRGNLSITTSNGPVFWIVYAVTLIALLAVPGILGTLQGFAQARLRLAWTGVLLALAAACSVFLIIRIPEYSWAPVNSIALFIGMGWPFIYSLRRTAHRA